MEAPRDDISSMSVERLMAQVRRLGLLSNVNRLVWEALVARGMYHGNPDIRIPDENKYHREEILNMKRDTDIFVRSLPEVLPKVKELVTIISKPPSAIKPVPGGLQFKGLPWELQAGILGRVSPTAREGLLVSKGVKELADVAFMDNIHSGNLVDPTISIPERSNYFKLDTSGNGKYFSPEPALWQSFKRLRSGDIPRDNLTRHEGIHPIIPVLIYGTIIAYPNPNLKFVSLAVYLHHDHTTDKLPFPHFMSIYPYDRTSSVVIRAGKSQELVDKIHETHARISDRYPQFNLFLNAIISEIKAGTLEPYVFTGDIYNRTHGENTETRKAQFRIIPLNVVEFNAAQMILPSLQDGVGTL